VRGKETFMSRARSFRAVVNEYERAIAPRNSKTLRTPSPPVEERPGLLAEGPAKVSERRPFPFHAWWA